LSAENLVPIYERLTGHLLTLVDRGSIEDLQKVIAETKAKFPNPAQSWEYGERSSISGFGFGLWSHS
jgi:hypothetical protein